MRISITILLSITLFSLSGQDLSSFNPKDSVSIKGSMQIYHTLNIKGNQLQQQYGIQTQITPRIFGFPIPLSLSYGKDQRNFSSPIDQFQFNPSYKRHRLYIGKFYPQLSSFTLSGTPIKGFGLDTEIKKFTFKSYTGTYKIPIDSTEISRKLASISVGRYQSATSWEVSLMASSEQSLFEEVAESFNQALEIQIQTLLLKKVQSSSIFALSHFTGNPRGNLYSVIQQELMIPWNQHRFTLHYGRISPGYSTFGLSFLQNDYEKISAQIATALFNQKLRLSGEFGTQRNDLHNTSASQQLDLSKAINIQFKVSKALNLQLSYTDFQSIVKINPLQLPLDEYLVTDSILYEQLNNRLQLIGSWRKSNQQFNLSYQHSHTGNTSQPTSMRTEDRITLSHHFKEQRAIPGISTSLLFREIYGSNLTSTFRISLRKSFQKIIQCSITTRATVEDFKEPPSFQFQTQLRWKVKAQHQFALSGTLTPSKKPQPLQSRLHFTYQFQFEHE